MPMPASRSRLRAPTIAALLLLNSFAATAVAEAQGFATGAVYAGPRIWTGNLNGATAIGVQAEKGLTAPGKYGPGVISAGIGVDWYSWDFTYPGGKYEYSVVPIQAFSNYHFAVKSQPKLDPYAGLALVYSVVNATVTGLGSASASASGTDIAGQVGARWFFTEKFAAQGQLGFGYGTLSVGATWKF
ncbi:MAG: hypothetical protein K2Y26_04505 [Gemmatimonadaceae bacterium]|nr:hypothetical protein [Gemmatimonadaceae bacterium]